jgi:hypothetical protein
MKVAYADYIIFAVPSAFLSDELENGLTTRRQGYFLLSKESFQKREHDWENIFTLNMTSHIITWCHNRPKRWL